MPSAGTAPTIVYVACAEDREIAVLMLDPGTGALRELARTPVPGTNEPSPGSLPLALSADRRFLYAALRSPPFPVSSYAIDPVSGLLRHLGSAALPDSMAYLATDATGRHLFSASYGGSKLAVNAIDADGVARDATQVLATPPKAHSVRPDPANRFVYAACLGGDVVLAQSFDAATGRMDTTPRPVAATRPDAGPRHFVFARGGALLYVINELDGSINTYARDAETGALTELQSISMLPPGVTGRVAAADIHLTPDGRFLYGSDRTTNTLAGFRVDPATGLLSLATRVASEPTPRGFAIDPAGRFLLCAGLASGRVGIYAIDGATGALERVGAQRVGGQPNWIEIIRLA
ncbi:lactonase family protein [Limobrevibacterium gyesilva]|uniref:Lactonase family protein n=1 Tax=Limobrevibacterium gyesilva TaxID=2991712 RepID=A0AA41YN97_9PROT|nr:lactonase family protein [Limobrevibacterium gyesilva]MCW3475845.1 lactonase family protein [Limobrevibacterium gyesilva]